MTGLNDHSIYKKSEKDWLIQLEQSTCFWYDLLHKDGKVTESIHLKDEIKSYLKKLKENVESKIEKRFIYFIATRIKVRFDTNKKVKYNFFTKSYTIQIIIGKNKKKKIKFKVPFKVKIIIAEKFITLESKESKKLTFSIHDFLLHNNIKLNIGTEIHYVGITKNPHTRPTNGSHSGLTDVLYNFSSEEQDVFLFFNIFKVNNDSVNVNYGIKFVTTNSMVDEIDVETEGSIIEKLLIYYFNTDTQCRNKENEVKELRKNLNILIKEHNFNSLQFHLEFGSKNEYWEFYSSQINKKFKHIFSLRIKDNDLFLDYSSELYDYYSSMNAIV